MNRLIVDSGTCKRMVCLLMGQTIVEYIQNADGNSCTEYLSGSFHTRCFYENKLTHYVLSLIEVHKVFLLNLNIVRFLRMHLCWGIN